MSRYLLVAAVAAAGILGGALQPTAGKAEVAGVCGDELWTAYNNCLMSTSSSFVRTLCDLEYTFAWMACRGVKF